MTAEVHLLGILFYFYFILFYFIFFVVPIKGRVKKRGEGINDASVTRLALDLLMSRSGVSALSSMLGALLLRVMFQVDRHLV